MNVSKKLDLQGKTIHNNLVRLEFQTKGGEYLGKLSEQKTNAVLRVLNGPASPYLVIYFKVCLVTNTRPEYDHFCALLNRREVEFPNIIFPTNDSAISRRKVNSVIREWYKSWLHNYVCFTPEEIDIMNREGLTNHITSYVRQHLQFS